MTDSSVLNDASIAEMASQTAIRPIRRSGTSAVAIVPASHSTVPQAHAPIGVFDSGVGGLTVARRILERLPGERIVYVADQAHVPYGGRPLDEVRGFAAGISRSLFEYGCKAIVMACNISSAVGLSVVRAAHPDFAVFGMIAPGACRAVRSTRNGRIGVLATAGTVHSGAYTAELLALNSELEVVEVACPDFVPLVEAGKERSGAAVDAAIRYLAPIRESACDTVILGCTHYPYLLDVLRAHWPEPAFIDPAEQAALDLADHLATANLLATKAAAMAPRHLLTTTGNLGAFDVGLDRFLPGAVAGATAASAEWRDGRLILP